MNEYNFGPHIENIKSYYNTLDFESGIIPPVILGYITNNN